MALTKSKIVALLFIIGIISFGFKIYFVDFSEEPTDDSSQYVLHAINFSNDNFDPSPFMSSGWSLAVFPFYNLIHSENFIEYTNVSRYLGIFLSSITIIPIYLLARKFFPEKYSLVAASLFAFQPHINQNAGSGLPEPLFLLIFIISFFFILNNNKYVYLSFLCAGILWWISWPGAMMFIILSVIFFVNFKKTYRLFLKYGLCVIIFGIIVSPMLIQRNMEYDNPLYFEYGVYSFSERTITTLNSGFELLFPYLIILIPFGILFSLRPIDQSTKYVKANWILILLTIAFMIIPFSIISETRSLLYLYPFLILFSVISIQRVTEYGFSTFSFSIKQKNIFLIIIITLIIILATLFMFNMNGQSIIE